MDLCRLTRYFQILFQLAKSFTDKIRQLWITNRDGAVAHGFLAGQRGVNAGGLTRLTDGFDLNVIHIVSILYKLFGAVCLNDRAVSRHNVRICVIALYLP
jgi:hypothetical protein